MSRIHRFISPRWMLALGAALTSLALLIGVSLAAAPLPHTLSDSTNSIDVRLPSPSTGSTTGTLALRIHPPATGEARYDEGAPILVWAPGGDSTGSLQYPLPSGAEDLIVITFLFPGGVDPQAGRHSDGVYDHRGPDSIAALRDVLLYAAGVLTDVNGQRIDELVSTPVLHHNVGIMGSSNGGNVALAVAAEHGADLAGSLRYVIQWESPVSSQAATTDMGFIQLECPPDVRGENDFVNPRYTAYGPLTLTVDYADLTYNPAVSIPIFHDGNSDGLYSTVQDPTTGCQTPDLDLDGALSTTEDFPLTALPGDTKYFYSRPASHALEDQGVITGTWPTSIAAPAEADAYWDLREAVRLYDEAVSNIPNLAGMLLCSERDHVQSAPDKPHIHQAFEGWRDNGAWVQINPSPTYMIEVDPDLADRDDLPHRVSNRPPADWSATDTYCVPEDIPDDDYQLAGAYQMADRAQGVFKPAPAGAALITYVDSEGDNIAVRIEVPERPRYPEGAPVVVEVSTWFVPGDDFHRVNDTTQIGAVTVSYLWPERVDVDSGARSEGVYDYGGPRSLEALRDVIRFASGATPDVAGRTIDELMTVTPITDNVGLFASSHSGIVATNVLAHHGSELPQVKYLVGRENPTRDEMYACELGHFDDEYNPVYNPFFDEGAYSPITVTVAYSTVGWYEDPEGMDRPYFEAGNGHSAYILGEKGPRLWDNKRYYSRELTKALLDSSDLTPHTWPEDVATYTETVEAWSHRVAVHNYPKFITQTPELKVMLVFADADHVQAPQTKPHIHQAWDGFRHTAGLWVRMNPDLAYVQAISSTYETGFPDNPANAEPDDWSDIEAWGFSAAPLPDVRKDVWLASVAEMADRVRTDSWDEGTNDLDSVLVQYPPQRLFLPLILRGYSTASIPPVYVTVAGHIEDTPIYTNCDAYPNFRQELLLFAETISQTGAAVNLQVEYEFFQGVSQCETEAMQAETDGQNVLNYLATRYGYEIDPHQEGGWEEGADNYADVRFLGEQVAPSISDSVGGLVWDDAEQFARLAEGEAGWIYPDFTWQPNILTLAVSRDHHLGDFSRDDAASGIWRPKGAGQDFWIHDPDGSLAYVGPGEHANWDADRPWLSTPEFVQAVADRLEQGAIDREKMYTASIAVPQSIIFAPERHTELVALLDQLAPLVESDRAAYVTYTQAVEIWRTEHDAQPNIFFLEGSGPPSE